MKSLLTQYVSGKKRTLKYEFAVLVLGVWIIFSIRLLLSMDPAWIQAQSGNYSTVTWAAFAFIAAAVGLQTWQNKQPGDASEPGYETGELPSPASPESAARQVG